MTSDGNVYLAARYVFAPATPLEQDVLLLFDDPQVKTSVPVAILMDLRAGFGTARRRACLAQYVERFF